MEVESPGLSGSDSSTMHFSLRSLALGSAVVAGSVLLTVLGGSADADQNRQRPKKGSGDLADHVRQTLSEGQQTFRFDTFGDEAFWGDALGLHRAIAGAKLGGVGPGLSPIAALGVGLKVDVDALPQQLRQQLRKARVDLNDPATTIALLRLNAVVGVTGFFSGERLTSVGIQCALCHSTVDDSFDTGIGHRLDGWANRDLNVGAIVALYPDLSPFEKL